MLKKTIVFVALLCVAGILADHAFAQRGGGRGGQGGGGSTMSGGMCSRTNGAGTTANGTQSSNSGASFFGNDSGNENQQNQTRNMQQQAVPGARNNMTGTASSAQASGRRPTATQFAEAALKFDADADGELSSAELTQVAAAVIKELQARQQVQPGPMKGGNGMPGPQGAKGNEILPNVTLQEMTTTFVTKALTFDRDESGTLNAAETQALATALIRSLG